MRKFYISFLLIYIIEDTSYIDDFEIVLLWISIYFNILKNEKLLEDVGGGCNRCSLVSATLF